MLEADETCLARAPGHSCAAGLRDDEQWEAGRCRPPWLCLVFVARETREEKGMWFSKPGHMERVFWNQKAWSMAGGEVFYKPAGVPAGLG